MSTGFSRLWVLHPWIKRIFWALSVRPPCSAPPQCAPWCPVPHMAIPMTTLALLCQWTSTACSRSLTTLWSCLYLVLKSISGYPIPVFSTGENCCLYMPFKYVLVELSQSEVQAYSHVHTLTTCKRFPLGTGSSEKDVTIQKCFLNLYLRFAFLVFGCYLD